MFVTRVVAAYALPVNGLGCIVRIGILLDHVGVAPLGLSKVFLHESDTPERDLGKRPEVVSGQISLEARAFFAIGVCDHDRRRPRGVETVKVFGILLEMNIERNEVLVDKGRDFGVLVRLGFQPSTCTSRRRGAEIDQQRFVLFLCLA